MPVLRCAKVVVAAAALLALRPTWLEAQPFEVLGTRALGMAGAFVAVADDASAVYWNPAGQVVGSLACLAFDAGSVESGAGDDARKAPGPAGPAGRVSSRLLALTTPPIGIGYYRLQTVSSGGRPVGHPLEDQEVGRFVTSNLAVTIGQTLGGVVAVGGALRFVRGGRAVGASPAGLDPLERADDLDVESSGAFDVDLGAVVTLRRVRVGIVGRNLLAPDVQGPGTARTTFERQARVGLAVFASDRIVLALDADLTSSSTVTGERRNVAAGAESWWANRRLGVRAGFRASTIGETRPVAAVGATVGILPWLFADGQATRGEDESDRGWSAALAVRYGF